MFVSLSADVPPTLAQPADFAACKVVIAGDGLTKALLAAMASIGRIATDGRHVWIDQSWLRASGPQTAEWAAGLDRMIEFAVSHGWTDDVGAIRAHVEFTETF